MMTERKKRILVLASGDAEGGGSGFEKMVKASRTNPPILDALICGVVSNHPAGGVKQKAESLLIPFLYWPKNFSADDYQHMRDLFNPDYVMLSGWLKLVAGFNPSRTINIHPGPLPEFGGPGMYGHHVHEAVLAAYHSGKIKHSAVTMHFVNDEYDRGPIFFQMPVPIKPNDTVEELASRVNRVEHDWQSRVLNYVIDSQVWSVGGKVFYANDKLRRLLMPAG